MKLPKLGLTTKKSLKGYLYVSPFLIGFFAFLSDTVDPNSGVQLE